MLGMKLYRHIAPSELVNGYIVEFGHRCPMPRFDAHPRGR